MSFNLSATIRRIIIRHAAIEKMSFEDALEHIVMEGIKISYDEELQQDSFVHNHVNKWRENHRGRNVDYCPVNKTYNYPPHIQGFQQFINNVYTQCGKAFGIKKSWVIPPPTTTIALLYKYYYRDSKGLGRGAEIKPWRCV